MRFLAVPREPWSPDARFETECLRPAPHIRISGGGDLCRGEEKLYVESVLVPLCYVICQSGGYIGPGGPLSGPSVVGGKVRTGPKSLVYHLGEGPGYW